MAVSKMLKVCCVLCAESSVGDSHTRLGWMGLALCPSQLQADSDRHQSDCNHAQMQLDADGMGAKQAGGDHSSTAMSMTDCGDDFELFAEDADQLLHDATAFDAYPGMLFTHCVGGHWCVVWGGVGAGSNLGSPIVLVSRVGLLLQKVVMLPILLLSQFHALTCSCKQTMMHTDALHMCTHCGTECMHCCVCRWC
mgnify:CR=1 FL=1